MNEHRGTPDDPLNPLRYYVCIAAPFGSGRLDLSDEQAERYLMTPEAVISEILGVTYEEYLIWVSWGGRAQCEHLTAKGRRCLMWVPGLLFGNPADLKQYGGGYCATHAGSYREPA